ncbi:MAG: 50S ribosomal protein L18Ae [Candidatus Nanoarchaeia archaeon]|jgi:large subunit ribosomal protein LX
MMFEVKGSFRLNDKRQSFKLMINADNERSAVEKVMASIGSNHKCKRRFVKVEAVNVAKQ